MTTESKIYRERCGTRIQIQNRGSMRQSSMYPPSLTPVCALTMRKKRWGGVCAGREGDATQRGGGTDHLDKVQQKSVQIEKSRTPGAITTRVGTHCSYNAEVYSKSISHARLCSLYVSALRFQDPRGHSYPFSYIGQLRILDYEEMS